MNIDELERAWRRAYLVRERNDNNINDRRESEAWDALTEAKHELDMCLAPGCRVIDPSHSYCSDHRE